MPRPLLVALAVAALALLAWLGLQRLEEPAPDTAPETPPSAPPLQEGDADHDETPRTKSGQGPALEAKGQEKPAELPTVEPAPPPPNSVTVLGRVLDDRRRPVAGATVSIVVSYASEQEPPTGTTDASGHYRIQGLVRPSTWGHIVARARHKRFAIDVGASAYTAMPAELTMPVAVLGPSHALDVQVKHADGTGASGARVLLEANVMWSSAVVADVRTDAAGKAHLPALASGGYRVHGVADGYGRGTAKCGLPQPTPSALVITLGPERSLLATVVDKETGDPIEGAQIVVDERVRTTYSRMLPWVPAMPELVTDAAGQASIPGLSLEAAVQVNAEAAGYSGRGNIRMHRSIKPGDTEVRIELQKTRQIRWPLASDNPHAPPEGTELTFKQARGAVTATLPTSARIENGHIVAEECNAGLFHVIAVAPSGAFASVMASPVGQALREATFAIPRRVTVVLTHADGSPAEGYYVSMRGQGNNVVVDPKKLGPTGEHEFVIPYQYLLDVFAARTATPHGTIPLGSVNLKEETGGRVEATLPEQRPVELRILIDGEARLPPNYSVQGGGGVGAKDEDPAAGTLRFEVARSETEIKASFNAQGFLPFPFSIPPAEGDALAKVDITLARGGTVLLKIKPPTDGHHNVQVNKAGQMARGFRPPGIGGGPVELGTENGWVLRRLGPFAPGEYEASDAQSQARSGAFTVETGKESVVELDLSTVGNLAGRVTVPEGFQTRGARVSILAADGTVDPMARFSGTSVRADGTFSIRVPGNRTVTLGVTHPQLIAASPGGRVDVKEIRADVVLELIAGGSATFKMDPAPPKTRNPRTSQVGVYLYTGAPEGTADQRLMANLKDGAYALAGFKPGTYTMVFDQQGRAPAVMEKVTLGTGTDLGTVTTEAGATVRFRLKVKEGQDPPRIYANAHAKTGFTYTRHVNSRGEAEVLLKGLGAGTFDLHAMPMRGFGTSGVAAKGSLDKTIECDGHTEIVIDLDVR